MRLNKAQKKAVWRRWKKDPGPQTYHSQVYHLTVGDYHASVMYDEWKADDEDKWGGAWIFYWDFEYESGEGGPAIYDTPEEAMWACEAEIKKDAVSRMKRLSTMLEKLGYEVPGLMLNRVRRRANQTISL